MNERLTLVVQLRLFAVCALDFLFLIYAPFEMGTWKSAEHQVWKQFWLASIAGALLVLLFPLLRRRIVWLQVVAICLSVLPLLVLFWAVIDHFGR
jgi:hypothetical protein